MFQWLVPLEAPPHEVRPPDSLLPRKERDKRCSSHGNVQVLLNEAIQEVGIDLLNGSAQRRHHRLAFP